MVFWISPMVSLSSRANILASFTISRSGTPGCRLPALAAEAGVNFPPARASIAASSGGSVTLPGSPFSGNWWIVKVSLRTIFRCTPLMYERVSSRFALGVLAQVEMSRLPKRCTFSNKRASILELRVSLSRLTCVGSNPFARLSPTHLQNPLSGELPPTLPGRLSYRQKPPTMASGRPAP